jgi:YidC/Oxa1 family membrane protein insertase
VKQQQALMELYKKEKINPVAGCWPVLIQIPVFFALYKVLFVTIEMRHAPFFGWIRDLAAPGPDLDLQPVRPPALQPPAPCRCSGPFLMLGVGRS